MLGDNFKGGLLEEAGRHIVTMHDCAIALSIYHKNKIVAYVSPSGKLVGHQEGERKSQRFVRKLSLSASIIPYPDQHRALKQCSRRRPCRDKTAQLLSTDGRISVGMFTCTHL